MSNLGQSNAYTYVQQKKNDEKETKLSTLQNPYKSM